MTLRIFAGLALAAIVALATRRSQSLTPSGALAAGIIGLLATVAGWSWATLLISYFVVSVALSHYGAAKKDARTGSVVEKAGPRDARQVFANGAPFAAAALGSILAPHPAWAALAAGSLAGSAADTWSTEIGTLRGGEPRSILTWRPVPPGSSGGITAAGSGAGVAGALFIAVVCIALGWPRSLLVPVFLGGVAGGLLDSILGASIQARRWCDPCQRLTERHVHSCGANTRRVGGIPWFENDAVNLATTLAAGFMALALAR